MSLISLVKSISGGHHPHCESRKYSTLHYVILVILEVEAFIHLELNYGPLHKVVENEHIG